VSALVFLSRIEWSAVVNFYLDYLPWKYSHPRCGLTWDMRPLLVPLETSSTYVCWNAEQVDDLASFDSYTY